MSEQHIPDVTTSPILDKLLEFASFSASLQKLNNTDALWLCDIPTQDLVTASRQVTRQFADSTYNFCAIVNAKSGKCSEDCAWCAQSRRFRTAAPEYPLIRTEHVLQHARAVERAGIKRFSLVTSGRKLSPREVRETAEIVRNLKANTKLEICLSSGLLTKDELKLLHEAGVTRLHCNLESSAEFFPQVCTSHTSQDKIDTLLAARAVGMDLCSGGIIGMGESEADRIRLAVTLRNLQIPSIPINVLLPDTRNTIRKSTRSANRRTTEGGRNFSSHQSSCLPTLCGRPRTFLPQRSITSYVCRHQQCYCRRYAHYCWQCFQRGS